MGQTALPPPANLGFSGKHDYHYTDESDIIKVSVFFPVKQNGGPVNFTFLFSQQYVVYVDEVRLCLSTSASTGLIVRPPGEVESHGRMIFTGKLKN
jgi:hypothetical protein